MNMKLRYRLFLRRKSVYYAFDDTTKTFASLKTKDKAEANRLLMAMNEAGKQPFESQILFVIAELRPAEQLAQRAETVLQNLSRTPLFSTLTSVGLLGAVIVVPTAGVKATLERLPLT